VCHGISSNATRIIEFALLHGDDAAGLVGELR
jgi:hypothetical protein